MLCDLGFEEVYRKLPLMTREQIKVTPGGAADLFTRLGSCARVTQQIFTSF